MDVNDHHLREPVGRRTTEAAAARATWSEAYRAARAEYAAIRDLREIDPVAARSRERRFELGLTQRQVQSNSL